MGGTEVSYKQFPGSGIDIDAVHRTWPHQRKLWHRNRHPMHVWVMLALAVGFVIGLCVGVL